MRRVRPQIPSRNSRVFPFISLDLMATDPRYIPGPDYADFVVPILVGARVSPGHYKLARYAGVGFFLRSDGLLVTCKHVLEQAGEDESLFAQHTISLAKAELLNIRKHPRYDFGLAFAKTTPPPRPLELYVDDRYLGANVSAFGFVTNGRNGEDIALTARLFKGNVVRQGKKDTIQPPGAKSLLELSFPAHSGFSGAPVLLEPPGVIGGMLFGNLESAIESYSHSTVVSPTERIEERVQRIGPRQLP